jgi:pimeloyl-ACP methyl ester carboxylesterase
MEPAEPKHVCLVTVHGIGFQQAPDGDTPGYADELHKHLQHALGDLLGEDHDPAGRGWGPVYVESEWEGSRTRGLARLDEKKALVEGGPVAHIALVYSRSEGVGPQLGATIEASVRGLLTLGRYTSFFGFLGIIGRAAWGRLRQGRGDGRSSNVPRPAAQSGEKTVPARSILLAIQQDIAAYVCRNDVRERVRGFVQEALQLLLDRGDVCLVVVNAHSQGTVLCWDVLCRLPLFATVDWKDKIAAFVTAGSPIRKYVRVFSWGERVGQMAALPLERFDWCNVWDPCDPVADRLNPTPLVAVDPDSGDESLLPIADREVSNVKHSSGGGLQAHDYWNNREQFVKPLAEKLGALAAQIPPPTS